MRELPHALTKLFKIAESAGENISHVLNSSIAVINELLEQGGIGMVPDIEPPPPRRIVEELDEHNLNLDEGVAPSEESRATPNLYGRLDTPSSSIFEEAQVEIFPRQATALPRSPSPASPNRNEFFTHDAYIELLSNVIRIARQAILPHRDALPEPINGQFHPGFDHNATFGIRSDGQMRHDVKIGAAGELFVSYLEPNF